MVGGVKAFIFLLVVVCVGCGKKEQAKATPDASANKLFVESVQLISSAEEQTGEAAIKDYEQGLANIQTIIEDYSESDLAVKLISGETLFTGKSLKEIKGRVKELKRAESERLAAKRLESEHIVEKAIRKSLEKPEGQLTEADLAKVTELSLGGTQITDAGLKEVAKLQKLKELYLNGTQITDAGLKDLAKLQKLEELYLLGTRVTKAGVAELKKALPSCEIIGP